MSSKGPHQLAINFIWPPSPWGYGSRLALGCALIPESSTGRQSHRATRATILVLVLLTGTLSLSPLLPPSVRTSPTLLRRPSRGRATGATPTGANGSGAQSGFARTITAALRRKREHTRSSEKG